MEELCNYKRDEMPTFTYLYLIEEKFREADETDEREEMHDYDPHATRYSTSLNSTHHSTTLVLHIFANTPINEQQTISTRFHLKYP
jgi:hypothetical protein